VNLVLQVNLIIVLIFMIMCGLGIKNAFDDIRLRADHELNVSRDVASYAIDAQLQRLEMELSQPNVQVSQWNSRFHLEDLNELVHVDIELISDNGELLDSNHSQQSSAISEIPSWLENSLKSYLGHTEIISMPIIFAGQFLGTIVIRPNLNAEWNVIQKYIKRSFMPLILTFLIGSIFIAVIASLILSPVTEMLARQNKRTESSRSPVASLRLNQLLTVNRQLKLLKQCYLDTVKKNDVLNQQLIMIQETERKQLSAELHDEIGQHLTAIQFDVNAIKNSASLDEAKISAVAIGSIHNRMTGIFRSMLQRLRPPELDELGVQGAITELFNYWVSRHPQHHAYLSIEGDFKQLDEYRQLTLYRLVQECLTNVSRHAGEEALDVKVSIRCNTNLVSLNVTDNGIGYHSCLATNGYGLSGMRDRVEALSGSIDISTTIGKGVVLSATFPAQGVLNEE